MRRIGTWVAVAIAVICVIGATASTASFWNSIGGAMSTAGWIALVVGVLFSLALGVGLMTLVFISNRRGYDDLGGKDRR